MLRRIALLTILLVFASPCFADAGTMTLEHMIQRSQFIVQGKVSSVKVVIDEEYEVLSALVNEVYLSGDAKSIVITNPADSDHADVVHSDTWNIRYGNELAPVSSDTLDDFAASNKQSLTFEKRFKLKAPYHIVRYEDVKNMFPAGMPEEGWKIFYSKYPGSNGYLRLSRVGFNKARDQALVYTGWMRGALHGEGHYFLLGKQNGSWKVLRKVGDWVV